MRTSVIKRALSPEQVEFVKKLVSTKKLVLRKLRFKVDGEVKEYPGAEIFIGYTSEIEKNQELNEFVKRVNRINYVSLKHGKAPCFMMQRAIGVCLSGGFSDEYQSLGINFEAFNTDAQDIKKWATS